MEMNYDIRQLSFAEILDRSFRIFRDHFLLLVGISACFFVPFGLFSSVLETRRVAASIAMLLFMAILAPIVHIALTFAVANLYLSRPVTIGSAYRGAKNILTPAIGTFLLLDLLLLLAFLALMIPAVYFVICWALSTAVMVVEHRFGRLALRRSRQLITGVWWSTLGLLLVASLIVQVPVFGLSLLWSSIPVAGVVLNTAIYAVTAPYSSVVMIVYYFDRRCRIEDFDLRMLAEQIRTEGAQGMRAVSAPLSAS